VLLLLYGVTISDEEVGTEGKILLLALESGKLQAFGLNTKQQVSWCHINNV